MSANAQAATCPGEALGVILRRDTRVWPATRRNGKSFRRRSLGSIPPAQRYGLPPPGPSRQGRGGKPTAGPPVATVRRPGRKGLVVKAIQEPIVDVLDEGSALVVIAELPRLCGPDVQVVVRGSVLVLSAGSGQRTYYTEIVLPSPPDPRKVHSSFRNGIAEIRLCKLPGEGSEKGERPSGVR